VVIAFIIYGKSFVLICRQMMQLPKAFIENIQKELGDEASSFLQSLETPSPVSIRLNTFKKGNSFLNERKVAWCENGRYLPARPVFTLDPLLHAGSYYVQEASSMFLHQVFKSSVDTNATLKVLDLCAAPGGKSTLLLSLLNDNSLLVANEVINKRNNILCENITKWGCSNVVITQNEAKDFAALPEFFDVILVDAPCSGEGLFRKDAEAVNHWSEANVSTCATRQSEILKSVLPALKTGGVLIYSTCTYEAAENENAVKELTENENCSLQIGKIKSPEGVVKNDFGFRFYPHKIEGEGFFISCLKKEKASEVDEVFSNASKKQLEFIDEKKIPVELKQLLKEDFAAAWFMFRNEFCFAPKSLQRSIEQIGRSLNIRQVGTTAGSANNKDVVFNHALALSKDLKTSETAIELSRDEALKYLKGESLQKQADKGWRLVSYENTPLGWVKAIPGRLNNHYPKEWRIRMSL
jgi:16S rRNA C967 or C1407 C5-methylase (RsmB/RsmF family)/NOL1/NOP2/fmu family ribosome biogenesis protein